MERKKSKDALRINVVIYDQPAAEARELKQDGVVKNNADLTRQGIHALYQRWVDERLKILRMKTFEQTEES